GLARTVRSEKTEGLPGLDLEIDRVDCGELPEALGQLARLDDAARLCFRTRPGISDPARRVVWACRILDHNHILRDCSFSTPPEAVASLLTAAPTAGRVLERGLDLPERATSPSLEPC